MVVSIEVVFSKNKKIGSWLIRFFTQRLTPVPFNNIPSHVALLINNRWVFESTLESGIRVIPYSEWLQKNEEMLNIPYSKLEYSYLKEKLKPLKNKKYDVLGLVYFGYRLLLFHTIGLKPPTRNAAHISKKYFCSEVVGVLKTRTTQ